MAQNLFQSEPGKIATAKLDAGTYRSEDQHPMWGDGISLVLDLKSTAGEGTVLVTIEGKDPLSGSYYTLLASTAKAKSTTTRLVVHPNVAAVANLVAQAPVPSVFRVSIVVAAAAMLGTLSWEEVE